MKFVVSLSYKFHHNFCTPWKQGSWGQHGAHLGPAGPRWAPCRPHEPCDRTANMSWRTCVIVKQIQSNPMHEPCYLGYNGILKHHLVHSLFVCRLPGAHVVQWLPASVRDPGTSGSEACHSRCRWETGLRESAGTSGHWEVTVSTGTQSGRLQVFSILHLLFLNFLLVVDARCKMYGVVVFISGPIFPLFFNSLGPYNVCWAKKKSHAGLISLAILVVPRRLQMALSSTRIVGKTGYFT